MLYFLETNNKTLPVFATVYCSYLIIDLKFKHESFKFLLEKLHRNRLPTFLN